MKRLQDLVRPNIWSLAPYSCARNEFKGEARVYLDANENPYNTDYNRYPDPLQTEVKTKIARQKGVGVEQIMLGNGSDEPIDLVYRVFCEPGSADNVVAIEPTYGMYRVCADINNVEYRPVLLGEGFALESDKVLSATDGSTKAIWLCSPNNPTGNLLNRGEMEKILRTFEGIVVVDEAYVDFSREESWLRRLREFPNMIVLQTFSKAWGLAGVRCGMAFASEEIIGLFNKVKYPYNINILTQKLVSSKLDEAEKTAGCVSEILASRAALIEELGKLSMIEQTYPTDANFVLVRTSDANAFYNKLVERGIITRNRNKIALCSGCVRITVGTPAENAELIAELKKL